VDERSCDRGRGAGSRTGWITLAGTDELDMGKVGIQRLRLAQEVIFEGMLILGIRGIRT